MKNEIKKIDIRKRTADTLYEIIGNIFICFATFNVAANCEFAVFTP